MRGRNEEIQRKKMLTSVFVTVLFVGLLFVYYGSFFRPRLHMISETDEEGIDATAGKYSRKLGSNDDEDQIKKFSAVNDGFDEKSSKVDHKDDVIIAKKRHVEDEDEDDKDSNNEDESGFGNEDFFKEYNDTVPKTFPDVWHQRVNHYWKQMELEIASDTFRNIMDMKAHLGGFAAALSDKDVWVMNVVETDGPNTLKVIYDRGLIGTMHNWCEAFSTYPRTYDLLHAWTVFSDIDEKGCSIEDLLLEMDRILRPTGFVIIRDKASIVNYITKYLAAMQWNAWSLNVEPESDSLSSGDETILFARKQLWVPSESE